MNIVTDKPYMVFRKDGQYGAMYSIGISKKNQDGSYTNGYLPVRFRKGVILENKTTIYIKKSWLDFYIDKDKKTCIYVFINEFSTVDKVIEESKQDIPKKSEDNSEKVDPYAAIGDEFQLDADSLPF